jgi:hypothetical protein
MKKKKIVTTLLLLGFVIITAEAQQATTTSGGNAVGSGGVITYSIGQVVYTSNKSSNSGSIQQGIQQPYKILTLGTDDPRINLNMQAYPNPTSNYLTLNIDASISISNQSFNYQLFDSTGKLIENKKITIVTQNISMENLPSATYFLKVVNNNKDVKTFKIIKN